MELSICAQCGRHIEPAQDKPGWLHVAGYRPRHIAQPAETTVQPDTPTAREALHREATWGLSASGFDDAAAEANRLIDAYAHELAETIRDSVGGDGGFPDGMFHAADLIDPEAQQ